MGIVEKLRPKRAEANGADIVERIEGLMPERDPALAKARAAEGEALRRHEEAQEVVGKLKAALHDAEAALRAERLKLAEGIGSEEAVAKARKIHEAARDRHEGQEDLIRALAAKVAEAREAVRRAEGEARERARAALLRLAAENVQRRDELHGRIEVLVAEAGSILAAVERVCPEVPAVIGRNGSEAVMGLRREGWQNALPLLLGFVGENAIVRLQALFRYDPHAIGGGALRRWRRLAVEAGLLEDGGIAAAIKAEIAAEKRKQAEAELVARRVEAATAARLRTAWRAWGEADRRAPTR